MADPTHFLSSIEMAEKDIQRAAERFPLENDNGGIRYPVPPWVKSAITERDGHRCRLCNTRALKLEIDHIRPRSSFKKWELWLADRSDNLQWLCDHCNRSKSNRRVVFEKRLGITATCVTCAPPIESQDSGSRIGVWCRRCGPSHGEDESQIR